jgi:UDP-glucose 4-epimerase
MKDKILLVGGSGYLGRHLQRFLSSYYTVFISGTKGNPEPNYFEINFLEPDTYRNIEHNKFDLVIILSSSLAGLGTNDLSKPDLLVNTSQLAVFLQFLSEHNVTRKIIYTSSMTVYGLECESPVQETALLKPFSVYGLSKKMAEEIIMFFSESHNIKSLILRIPGIYGGSREAGYVHNTIKKALASQPIVIDTSGIGYWEAIEIADLCYFIHQLVENYKWEAVSDVVNVSYGEQVDFIDTAKLIVTELGSESELIIHGKGYVDFYLDNSKLKTVVDSSKNFADSLKKYINYCKNELHSS